MYIIYVYNICVYILYYIPAYICEKKPNQPCHSTYVQNNRAATCLDCERAPGDPPLGRYRAPSGRRTNKEIQEKITEIQENFTVKPMKSTCKTHGKNIEEVDSETDLFS